MDMEYLQDYYDMNISEYYLSGYLNYTLQHKQDYQPQLPLDYAGDDGPMPMHIVLGHMYLYIIPVLVGVGLVANLGCGCVLTFSKLHKLPLTTFVGGCVMSDCLFLLGLLCTWLATGVAVVYQSIHWCYFMNMLTNCSHFLSAWCGVATLVHCYLHTGTTKVVSALMAKMVMLGLTIVAVAVYVNLTLIIDALDLDGFSYCQPISDYIKVARLINKLDFFVNSVLPFIVTIILVVLTLHAVKCRRYSMIANGEQAHATLQARPSNERRQSTISSSNNEKCTQLALALCPIFIVKLILTVPSLLLRLVFIVREIQGTEHSIKDSEIIAESIAQYFVCLAYVLNGVLLPFLWRPYRVMIAKISRRILRLPVRLFKRGRRAPDVNTMTVLWQQNALVTLISYPKLTVSPVQVNEGDRPTALPHTVIVNVQQADV